MGKVIREAQGMLSAITAADGADCPADDWRLEYLNKPGLILLCEAENEMSGSLYIRYIPEDVSFDTHHMRTDTGDVIESKERIVIHTAHSTYDFTLSGCLTDEYAIFLHKLAEMIEKYDTH